MHGHILNFSIANNSGVISGDDGNRYSFTGANWQAGIPPHAGMQVDFAPQGSIATGIYADHSAAATVASGPVAQRGSQPVASTQMVERGESQEQDSQMGIFGLVLGAASLFLFWIPVVGWAIMVAGMGLSIVGFVVNRERGQPVGMAIAGIILNAIPLAIHTFVYGLINLVWKTIAGIIENIFFFCKFIPFIC